MATMARFVSLGLLFAVFGHSMAAEQVTAMSPVEIEVRRLDAQEADAALHGDYARLDELWAEDFVVNNPTNSVGLGRTGRLRMGGITYSSFERVPEFVSVRGDVTIIMGREVVVPKAPSANAGRTQNRRFTNIWMKTSRGWRLAARHANVIAGAEATPP